MLAKDSTKSREGYLQRLHFFFSVARKLPCDKAVHAFLEFVMEDVKASALTLRFLAGSDELHLVCNLGCAKKYPPKRVIKVDTNCFVTDVFINHKLTVRENDLDAGKFSSKEFANSCQLNACMAGFVDAGNMQGVLAIYHSTTSQRVFYDTQEPYFSLVCELLAALRLIEQADLDRRERENRTTVLQKIAIGVGHLEHTNEITEFVCQEICDCLHIQVVTIFLEKNAHLIRRATSGIDAQWFSEERYKIGEGLVGWCFKFQTSKITNDPLNAEGVKESNAKLYMKQIQGNLEHIALIPIQSSQGTIGVLRCINKLQSDKKSWDRNGFTSSDQAMLEAIAGMIAIAVESTRRVKRANLLTNLTSKKGLQDFDKLLVEILETSALLFDAPQSGFMLIEPTQRKTATIVNQYKRSSTKSPNTFYFQDYPMIDLENYELIQELEKDTQPLFIYDVQRDSRMFSVRELIRNQKIECMLIIPIVSRGILVGTLGIDWFEKKIFSVNDTFTAGILQLIASHLYETANDQNMVTEAIIRAERDSLTNGLHDLKGVLQAGVSLKLEEIIALINETPLLGKLPVTKKIATDIQQVLKRTRYVEDQLHMRMEDARDPVLITQGFDAALNKHCRIIDPEERFIKCSFNVQKKYGFLVQHNLYRIAQELITNSLRHGIAGKSDGFIRVYLGENPSGLLILEVEDNGRPFNLTKSGIGLDQIKRWAKEINFTLYEPASGGVKVFTVQPSASTITT